ncbi:MAG: hypothetical protein M0Q26_05500 [Chitinophagaceae bacterium]|nr:hypothetical protein [Chitinophagaceae bacterium]MDP1764026.1 hypothetical protein [Sediminibacterium sp.]MDP1811936.1 hypothetical protein [Sediminibacterium sp.]MDP3128402.1 hypothetical protein [Sediminibacterium sp.]
MPNKSAKLGLIVYCSVLLWSCTSMKKFSSNYFYENEQTLTTIEQSYKKLYQDNQFSVAFTDRTFNNISFEIITDSIKLIYEFEVTETRLQDTLVKYKFPVKEVTGLIMQMRAVKCIWINNLDYYSNQQKRSLVYMSFRPVTFRLPFNNEKYYTLTFYAQPQYFDSEGRLFATRQLRKHRKINDEIFRRINDRVCYTVSERFR